MSGRRRPAALGVLSLLAGLGAPAAAQGSLPLTPRAIVATARIAWSRWPDFGRYVDVVGRLYAERDAPIWLDGDHVRPAAHGAIGELIAASNQGLDPRDYDGYTLDSIARAGDAATLAPVDRVRFDVLLSVALVRYLDDLRGGRTHPPPLSRMPVERADIAPGVLAAIRGDSVGKLVTASAPQLAQYRNLQRLLFRYRQLAADSLLRPVPGGPTVRPGQPFPGLAALAHRLLAVGDLVVDSFPAEGQTTYDGRVERAVRRFQLRHGLEPDGVLGPATLEAVNTPFSHRVREIELALERLRWLPPLGHQQFVVVNIPQFALFAFDSTGGTGAPTLEMRVIVGKALDTRTPVMFDQMRYIEFRPYWNVPRSILVKEVIPALRRNPKYLQDNDMEMVGSRDRPAGDRPGPIEIGRLLKGELRVRQRPGPDNSLGLAKFVFPNDQSIYLHGTPNTQLFARSRRDFSHGCIRVEAPAALAAWLLRDQAEWNRDRIRQAMDAPTVSRVLLSDPVPVIIFYTTAVVRPDGSAWFYADIYGHDRQLDEALRTGPTPP